MSSEEIKNYIVLYKNIKETDELVNEVRLNSEYYATLYNKKTKIISWVIFILLTVLLTSIVTYLIALIFTDTDGIEILWISSIIIITGLIIFRRIKKINQILTNKNYNIEQLNKGVSALERGNKVMNNFIENNLNNYGFIKITSQNDYLLDFAISLLDKGLKNYTSMSDLFNDAESDYKYEKNNNLIIEHTNAVNRQTNAINRQTENISRIANDLQNEIRRQGENISNSNYSISQDLDRIRDDVRRLS